MFDPGGVGEEKKKRFIAFAKIDLFVHACKHQGAGCTCDLK